MARTMTTAMANATTADLLLPALFVTASFLSGPVYMWTGYGPVTWGGFTWLGIGTLGSISAIGEGVTVEAKGITLSLGGFDPVLLALVVNEFQLGAPVAIYYGLFAGGVLVNTPVCAWAGRMDQPTLNVAGEVAGININCESRLLSMNTPVIRRYTNDDQQLDYPGDRAFEFVPAVQEITINWGRTPANPNNT